MRYRFHRVVLLLAAMAIASGAVLSGCGQKGPLYLPDEPDKKQEQKKEKGPGPSY